MGETTKPSGDKPGAIDLASRDLLHLAYEYADRCVEDRKEGPASLAALRKLQEAVATVRDALTWVPVTKRMPERYVEVLIAFRDVVLPATGQYTASEHDVWGWCFPSENDPEDTGPITHWMRLPPTPRELGGV